MNAKHSAELAAPEILGALELRPGGARRRDLEDLTARCNEVLEGLTRRHPEQRMWAHRRP
ncbi:MAG: hypothetical protein V3R91_07645 [Myxococcota bacterium]